MPVSFLMQGVVCEGPVEGIISQLINSLSSTLQSQLTNAMTNYVTPSSAQSDHSQAKQFPSLTNLPHIWKSSLATQIVLLATQIALEISLKQIVQKLDSELMESFIEDINSLTRLAVAMMKGESLEDDDVTKPHPSDALEPSTSHDPDTSTVIITGDDPASTAAINEGQRSSSRAYLVLKSQTRKMENVILVLSSYRFKAEELRLISSTVRNVTNTFQWQSLLHYEWSAQDNLASVSTVGASLGYGYHYTGSASRLVLTPVLEKAVCYLLQTVKQGNSSLLLGKEVHLYVYVHVYGTNVPSQLIAC